MSLTVTDLFCGGGGSSTGMTQIPGVEVRMAANHWDLAVRVHNANHPDADHAASDLHEEDPRYFPKTDILWASPECTTWSQAGGDKYSRIPIEADLFTILDPDLVEDPLTQDAALRSRLLMFDVLRFAEHHRYRAMIVENVIDVAVRPKYRLAWTAWKQALGNLGYDHEVVSLNSMHAQALGRPAPQSRDRIYVVCWLKGQRRPDIAKFTRPRAWCPKCEEVVESQQAWKQGRTVGRYRQQYIYVHGACGTTVEPGWLPAYTAIDWSLPGHRIGDREKPLSDKTRARIAAGIARYWHRPFSLEAAGNTFERSPGVRTWPIEEVLRTLHTTASKALAIPVEGRDGKTAQSMADALRTMTTRAETAMVVPAGGTWNDEARLAAEAHRSFTTRDAYGVVQVPLHVSIMGTGRSHVDNAARPVTETLRSFTAEGNNDYLLMPYYGQGGQRVRSVHEPHGTLTTRDRYALLQRHNTARGNPAQMVTPVDEVMRSLTTKGHQSLITPGDVEAAQAQVDDCLFRMLEPHEVAAGMAFPADYLWEGNRRERVRLAGNAVTPPAARDLMAAVVGALS